MNRRRHFVGGFAISILAIITLNLKGMIFSQFSVLIMLLIGTYASRVPDILEPPKSRHHRKFFHSYAVLILLSAFSIYSIAVIPSNGILFVLFIMLGYLSHLILDLPSLPVI